MYPATGPDWFCSAPLTGMDNASHPLLIIEKLSTLKYPNPLFLLVWAILLFLILLLIIILLHFIFLICLSVLEWDLFIYFIYALVGQRDTLSQPSETKNDK